MWQIVSNVSSVVTCVLFLLYIVGHIWKVFASKSMLFEKFEMLPFEAEVDFSDKDHVLEIDPIGSAFSISSPYGIRSLKIYKGDYVFPTGDEDDKGHWASLTPMCSYEGLNVNDVLYVRCDLGELLPTTLIEIERMDYTKVTFIPVTSGKTGALLGIDYHFKMTVKSFFYYLCV